MPILKFVNGTLQNDSSMETEEELQLECSVCYDDVSESKVMDILGDIVCDTCIKSHIVPQFENAIKYEHYYPPKFGAAVLSFHKFSSYFDDATFEARWSFRALQYSIHPSARASCKHVIKKGSAPAAGDCGDIALKTTDVAQVKQDGEEVEQCGAILHPVLMCNNSTCHSCSGWVCHLCGAVSTRTEHTCEAPPPEDPDAAIKAMGDLKKGKDWQQCPGCKNMHELAEACNLIRCTNGRCQMSYCFICGIGPLEHDSDHWKVGSACPRYGQPDNERAIHDEFEDPQDDDDDAEAGAEGDFAEDWAELNAVRHPAM